MLGLLQHWRRRRRLQRARLADNPWQWAIGQRPSLVGLSADEQQRLRNLASLFLVEKALEPAGGLALTPEMGVLIAAQACLPILNLGLDYYRDWRSVILYPEGFLAHHEYTDATGLVHSVHRPLIGEAWERGPVILSWADVVQPPQSGQNVVIHEMAHKLDMLNGAVNGLPPLHDGMAVSDWSRALNAAYRHLCQAVDQGLPTVLDPYAAESPAEFFASVSEAFFETPERVSAIYPRVYRQLQAFYRQDPLARRPAEALLLATLPVFAEAKESDE